MPKKNMSKKSVSRVSEKGMNRREFFELVTVLGFLGYIDSTTAAMALETNKTGLGWLANQEPGREGAWKLTDIDGEIPKEIDGTLFRTGPGQKINHGTKLDHVFDGDAFVSGYSMRDGEVNLRTQFVNTPERVREQKEGRMIYAEFGTFPPRADGKIKPVPMKNQPSVNIIPWDGRVLALSEGGHPSELDPKTLKFRSYWDFYGTLGKFTSFTAHPKLDTVTGVGYAYGNEQGPGMALTVFRMERSGKLAQLHKLPQKGYFMIHDMVLMKEHILFAIPPIRFSIGDLLSGRATLAKAMKYYESEPLRFVLMSRDGSGKPITIEMPSNSTYHNGNAFEANGKIIVDLCLAPDNGVSDMLNDFSKGIVRDYAQTNATRVVLDPVKGIVQSRNMFGEGQDFPRFDDRQTGKDMRYLYAMEAGDLHDPLANARVVRHDLHKNTSKAIEAGKNRCFGETVFVPHPGSEREDRGWLMGLMYDADRNETAVAIHDAETLDFVGRAWTGTHLPLGFHGNFANDIHIAT